jgi:hypothetical protein
MEPIHIQMNANSFRLSVINATHKSLHGITLNAKVIDSNMNTRWLFTDTLSVDPSSYKESRTIPKINNITPIYFVKLELKDNSGRLISDNIYWHCSQHEDFSPLTVLPKVKLNQDLDIKETDQEYKITLNLNNRTKQLSFFNHLILRNPITHQEVLPVFWSDNFVTLFPDEVKIITAVVAKADMNGQRPIVDIE